MRIPKGGTWQGWGTPVPTTPSMPASPWCLLLASEVAPSCPLSQASRDHPTQTPANRGTLRVPRSRSNWKPLSSTHPRWYKGPLLGEGSAGWGQGPREREGPRWLGCTFRPGELGSSNDFWFSVSPAPTSGCICPHRAASCHLIRRRD